MCVFSNYIVDDKYRFIRRVSIKPIFKNVLSQTFYSGVQQFFFSAVFVTIFAIAGRINSEALAVVTVLNNVLVLLITPLIGLGLASTTFVGMSIGSKEERRAMQWGNTALLMGLLFYALQLGSVFFTTEIFNTLLSDLEITNNYRYLMEITIFCVLFEVLAQVLKFSLFGAGKSKSVAKYTVFLQWALFIPLISYSCLVLGYGVEVLWGLFLLYRAVEALFIAYIWFSKSWFISKAIKKQ